MDENSLDCVAQDVHNALCLVAYGLQDVVMSCETTREPGESLNYVLDDVEMNVIWGALEVVRSARDKLNQALQTV